MRTLFLCYFLGRQDGNVLSTDWLLSNSQRHMFWNFGPLPLLLWQGGSIFQKQDTGEEVRSLGIHMWRRYVDTGSLLSLSLLPGYHEVNYFTCHIVPIYHVPPQNESNRVKWSWTKTFKTIYKFFFCKLVFRYFVTANEQLNTCLSIWKQAE